jgi:tRNA-2-methylthio-N6-dimethylallyladenosine synthase
MKFSNNFFGGLMTDIYLEETLKQIDETGAAPIKEPMRQYYFIKKLRKLIAERTAEAGHPLTYNIQTFGCQMNAKDSEKLAGILKSVGYVETDTEKADFVLYNTCTVRENANTKVYGRIGYLGNLKSKNKNMIIALCGCMMQEEHVVAKIEESYRFVDIIFGTFNIYKLAELIFERFTKPSKKPLVDVLQKSDEIVEELPSEQKYGFKAGVNIMYGCNNFCSYCIVPYVRGREKSRRPEDIVNEVKELVSKGVIEVMLLGQNVNSYGKNFDEPVSFAKLLNMVSKIEGLQRIRFMTPHPKDLSDELIEEIAVNPKVCKHVHLPLQSGSTEILKKMNRHYTKEDYLKLVNKIKERIPEAAVTADIIVGFPGETEEDFQETIDVVKKAGYIGAYTFQYSPRRGTPAAKLPGHLTDEVMKDRFDRLLEVIHECTAAETVKAVGSEKTVLAEEYNEAKGTIAGRLDNNLLVHFTGDKELLGKLVNVRLDECKGFYYLGSIL